MSKKYEIQQRIASRDETKIIREILSLLVKHAERCRKSGMPYDTYRHGALNAVGRFLSGFAVSGITVEMLADNQRQIMAREISFREAEAASEQRNDLSAEPARN